MGLSPSLPLLSSGLKLLPFTTSSKSNCRANSAHARRKNGATCEHHKRCGEKIFNSAQFAPSRAAERCPLAIETRPYTDTAERDEKHETVRIRTGLAQAKSARVPLAPPVLSLARALQPDAQYTAPVEKGDSDPARVARPIASLNPLNANERRAPPAIRFIVRSSDCRIRLRLAFGGACVIAFSMSEQDRPAEEMISEPGTLWVGWPAFPSPPMLPPTALPRSTLGERPA